MRFTSWLATSRVRHFPLSPAEERHGLTIDAAMNERFSFQVALRMDGERHKNVRVTVEAPEGWAARVRRVGYVPVRHRNTPASAGPLDADGAGYIPGYVPDPLFDEDTLSMADGEAHAFWVTVTPGAEASPGRYAVVARVKPEGGAEAAHTVNVRLHDVMLKQRTGFPVTNWFYVDALMDWYNTNLGEERLWALLEKYIRDVVEHGQDTLLVPVFTPPTDGVKRPTQLLQVTCEGEDKYGFDWRDVRRYVRLAGTQGVRHFEWCHFFTQWGAQHPLRVYEGQGQTEKLLWNPDIPGTSPTYHAFLAQYLPALKRFLAEEGIEGRSFFHVSDEPEAGKHLENYRRARDLLRDLAPWMKVMDALSEIAFAEQGLTDMPVPSVETALEFARAGIPCWVYYAVGPLGPFLNRLLDTPLAKIGMHGFLYYRWPFLGNLHWGYNYWYRSQTRELVDPYTVQDGSFWDKGWPYGDCFLVYPGPDGPVDSLRWEVIGEALQDYALLQTLGVDREDALLRPIVSFHEFPKDEAWRLEARASLLGHR